ncbi:MAG: PKD domain-containing protein [Deltaproteobacteria bacterium]|nr:PKD domain-containing protein [Deltaproteobacteria bacterium]
MKKLLFILSGLMLFSLTACDTDVAKSTPLLHSGPRSLICSPGDRNSCQNNGTCNGAGDACECDSPYYWEQEDCQILHTTADPATINGLFFDASSSTNYVSVPPTTDFTIDAKGITFEAWVNLDERQYANARAGAVILSTGGHPSQGATDYGGVMLAYNGSSFYLASERIYVTTSATGKRFTNGCHHVSAFISKDGWDYEAAIFVDGEELVRDTKHSEYANGDVNVDADIVIGGSTRSVAQMFGGTAFNGFMRDIRIWRGPRTANEIAADMGSDLTGAEPGLLANWKLNDGGAVGGQVSDVMGQNHGTLMGGEYSRECDESCIKKWYRDSDNDTWGDDAAVEGLSCYKPDSNYTLTANAGDCDDADASINPDASDYPPNGIDDNCDGVADIAISGDTTVCPFSNSQLPFVVDPAPGASYAFTYAAYSGDWFGQTGQYAGTVYTYPGFTASTLTIEQTAGGVTTTGSLDILGNSQTPSCCGGLTVDFNHSSACSGASTSFWSTSSWQFSNFEWYVNDTATATGNAMNYTFTQPGEYRVRLVASGPGGSCVKETQKTITIYDFDINGPTQVCPLSVNKDYQLTSANLHAFSNISWNIPNAQITSLNPENSSVEVDFNYFWGGNIAVQAQDINGCFVSRTQSVTVDPICSGDFTLTVSPDPVPVGECATITYAGGLVDQVRMYIYDVDGGFSESIGAIGRVYERRCRDSYNPDGRPGIYRVNAYSLVDDSLLGTALYTHL